MSPQFHSKETLAKFQKKLKTGIVLVLLHLPLNFPLVTFGLKISVLFLNFLLLWLKMLGNGAGRGGGFIFKVKSDLLFHFILSIVNS